MSHPSRCHWAEQSNPRMQHYHDTEWGRPVHDDQLLFEALSLELMQSGLSWQTILNKRENFRTAFLHFDFSQVAQFDDVAVDRLLKNDGIVRHKQKIQAIITNAKVIETITQTQSFDAYIHHYGQHCLENPEANTLHLLKQMKKDGFKFIGPTTLQSFLESIGIYNGHEADCDFR